MKINCQYVIAVSLLFFSTCVLQGETQNKDTSYLSSLSWGLATAKNKVINYFAKEPQLIALVRKRGDLDAIRYFATLDPNVQDRHGMTALLIAAQQDNIPVMEILLSINEINVNAVYWDGITPLHFAVINESITAMDLLLSSKASIEQGCDSDIGSPLLFAARRGARVSTIAYLISKGADAHYIDQKGNTILHYAFLGNLDLVVYLVSLGINPNHENLDGMTPLLTYANSIDSNSHDKALSEQKVLQQIQYFVTVLGIDIHRTSVSGLNLLNIAASKGWTKIVAYCIQSGLSSNQVVTLDDVKTTPLYWAVYQHLNYDMVRVLLEEGGADVNGFVFDDGSTLLHYAAARNHVRIYNLLIDHGADTSVVNKSGCKPEDFLNKERGRPMFTHWAHLCKSVQE